MIATLPLLLLLAQSPGEPQLESRAQALSPDEKLFAYAVSDGTVRIAQLPEGKPIVIAGSLATDLEALAFSPDGKSLAGVTHEGQIQILSCATGALLHEYPAGAHMLPVWSRPTIEFVDEGTRILVTGAQACARLLEFDVGACVHEFLAASDLRFSSESIVQAVAISNDRRHLALGDAAGWLSVRSTHTGDIEAGPFRFPTVNALAFNPGATHLAVGSSETVSSLWILPLDGASALELISQEDEFYSLFGRPSIGSVCFSPDGKNLLTADLGSGELRLWDVGHSSILWSNEMTDVRGRAVATSCFVGQPPVVVVAHSGTVLNAESGVHVRTLSTQFDPGPYCVGGHYAWAISPGKITIVDPSTGKLVCEIPLSLAPPPPKSTAQALSPDEKLFAYAVDDGTVHIATLPDGNPWIEPKWFPESTGGLAFSPDGKELAVLSHDGWIRILATANGALLAEFAGATSDLLFPVHSPTIEFVDGGSKLLLPRGDSEARLIEREDGLVIRVLSPEPTRRITASAVSADRRHFALGGKGGHFAVYSATTGSLECGPIQTPPPVQALDFDPEATRLAVGSGDCHVRLYPLRSGPSEPRLLSHSDKGPWGDPTLDGDQTVGFVKFSPDGKQLLSSRLPYWETCVWDLERARLLWKDDDGVGTRSPMLAEFVSLPRPAVITCKGKIFDAIDGEQLPGIGDAKYWDFQVLAGPYAWRDGPLGLEFIDVRTRKHVCTLPLAAK